MPEVRGTADVRWRSLFHLPLNPLRTHSLITSLTHSLITIITMVFLTLLTTTAMFIVTIYSAHMPAIAHIISY